MNLILFFGCFYLFQIIYTTEDDKFNKTDILHATRRLIGARALDTEGWSNWMPWECPVTCGGGLGARTRICYDPDYCRGPPEQRGECNPEPCPTSLEPQQQMIMAEIQNYLLATHQTFQLKKGDPVLLPCKGAITDYVNYYAPNAQVTWLRNGDKIVPDKKRVLLKDNQDLEIRNSTTKDNGVFLCILNLNPDTPVTTSLSSVTVQNSKPDMVVSVGYPFTLPCHGELLSRVFPNGLIQKWFHNTTLYKEFNDPNVKEIVVESSKYSHSGSWLCKMAESAGGAVAPREWPTNMVIVKVVPPPTLVQRLIPFATFGVFGAVVFLVFCCCVCCRRGKKGKKKEKKKSPRKFRRDDESSYPLRRSSSEERQKEIRIVIN